MYSIHNGHLVLQVYQNLKLLKHLDHKATNKGLEHALASALAVATTPAASSVKSAEPQSTISKEVDSSADTAGPGTSAGVSDRKEDTRQEATAGGKDSFDPPKHVSQAEQKRRFPAGSSSFPCLNLLPAVSKGKATQAERSELKYVLSYGS